MDIVNEIEEYTNKPSATQRGTRWAPSSHNDAGVIGFPTAITSPMTTEQLDAYVTAFRIEEITQALRAGDVVPSSNWNRAPSPEPEYDSSGRRTNTAQQRYRRHLEDERHRLVEHAMKSIPNYRAPYDYRRPTKFTEKVYVPVKDYPHVNFIGQILGPRGNSLKAMNTESGANIVLRGRGSVKEGRATGRSGGQVGDTNNNQREPLHCLVTAESQGKVNKAKELLQAVISSAASTSEWDKERKRRQLQDLAKMNGTFRDDEGQGRTGRLISSSTDTDLQNNTVSRSASTLTRDLVGQILRDDLEEEYRKLMTDVGGKTDTNHDQAATNLPPWRRARQMY